MKRQCRGFTLLELLVAIGVFSVLAIMSYSTLSGILKQQGITREKSDQLNRAQKAMLHLERDILQIVVRPIRDQYGLEQGAVIGDEYKDIRLEFTRTGRPNPNFAPRSYLQRISYAMPQDEEGKLYRYVWPSLDRADGAEPLKMLLLDDVEEMTVRFYDNQGEEQGEWPPVASQATGQSNLRAMPRGIKVVLKLKSMGEIWRLLEMPGS
ncbi:MAG: type II secretion system minor pseudopilin GspJ [Gammaproteobacteria bacterium]|nr:type II secretion system minor pseudopilin GspJ [Gammaproteobacteria bacterium]